MAIAMTCLVAANLCCHTLFQLLCCCRWPDFGIPDTTTPLRRLAHLLSSSDPSQAGPPVVHCSAGIGRTGTFLVIDVVLKHLLSLDPNDIAGRQCCWYMYADQVLHLLCFMLQKAYFLWTV